MIKAISRRKLIVAGIGGVMVESIYAPLGNVFRYVDDVGGQLQGKSIYQGKPSYDILPNYIHWSYGGHSYAKPEDVGSLEFKYHIGNLPHTDAEIGSAVDSSIGKIEFDRRGRVVALLYSGGIGSQVIALALHRAGIPFELYFANFWGVNSNDLDSGAIGFAAGLGKKVNVISLERSEFISDHLEPTVRLTGCTQPTYLALSMALHCIPESQFIVLGEGGLDKLAMTYPDKISCLPIDKSTIPVKSGEVFYRIWAQNNRRLGQYYFFNSTPEIISAIFRHPCLNKRGALCDTTSVFTSAFPDIRPRRKTTNWDENPLEKHAIKKIVLEIASKHFGATTIFRRGTEFQLASV